MSFSFAVVDSMYVSLSQIADKLCMAASKDDVRTLDTQVVLHQRSGHARSKVFRYSDPLHVGAQLLRVNQDTLDDGTTASVCVSAFFDTLREEDSSLDDKCVRREILRLARFLGDIIPAATMSSVGGQIDIKWSCRAPSDLSIPPYYKRDKDVCVGVRGKSADSGVRVTVLRAHVICSLEESFRVRQCLVNMLLPLVVARSEGMGAFVTSLFEHTYILRLNNEDLVRFHTSSVLSILNHLDQRRIDEA